MSGSVSLPIGFSERSCRSASHLRPAHRPAFMHRRGTRAHFEEDRLTATQATSSSETRLELTMVKALTTTQESSESLITAIFHLVHCLPSAILHAALREATVTSAGPQMRGRAGCLSPRQLTVLRDALFCCSGMNRHSAGRECS